MNRPRVLISDSMSSLAISVFEQRGVEAVASAKLTEDELMEELAEYEKASLICLLSILTY